MNHFRIHILRICRGMEEEKNGVNARKRVSTYGYRHNESIGAMNVFNLHQGKQRKGKRWTGTEYKK